MGRYIVVAHDQSVMFESDSKSHAITRAWAIARKAIDNVRELADAGVDTGEYRVIVDVRDTKDSGREVWRGDWSIPTVTKRKRRRRAP